MGSSAAIGNLHIVSDILTFLHILSFLKASVFGQVLGCIKDSFNEILHPMKC